MNSNHGRLPAIGISRLPKIGEYSIGHNSPKNLRSDKENLKIREISRAYKVNMNQLEEIKDKNLMVKRLENNKGK